MKIIDLMYQTMLAELGQRSIDAAWTADFPPEGRFVTAAAKGKRYWYFDMPDETGGKKRRYVGPAEDREISQRVEFFKREKDDLRLGYTSLAQRGAPPEWCSGPKRTNDSRRGHLRRDTNRYRH